MTDLNSAKRKYFSGAAGSLGSKKRFIAANPQFSTTVIDQLFARDPTLARVYPKKVLNDARYQQHAKSTKFLSDLHIDLGEFQSISFTSKPGTPVSVYRYFLVIVDLFSSYMFTAVIKRKSDTAAALETLLKKDILPLRYKSDQHVRCYSDFGSEFHVKKTQQMLETLGVQPIYLASSESKSFRAELGIRFLKSKMYLIHLSANSGQNRADYLKRATQALNLTKSQSLNNYTPEQTGPKRHQPAMTARMSDLFPHVSLLKARQLRATAVKRLQFKPGDYVCIYIYKYCSSPSFVLYIPRCA